MTAHEAKICQQIEEIFQQERERISDMTGMDYANDCIDNIELEISKLISIKINLHYQ